MICIPYSLVSLSIRRKSFFFVDLRWSELQFLQEDCSLLKVRGHYQQVSRFPAELCKERVLDMHCHRLLCLASAPSRLYDWLGIRIRIRINVRLFNIV